MKLFWKILISVLLFISFSQGAFAANDDADAMIEKTKNEIQKTVNTYILEVYKKQGAKILQELDGNLEKMNSSRDAKIETYGSIQTTLKLKKESVEKDTEIGKNSKKILIQYLDFMIGELENRKKNL
ncbi:MAG: hypothetical protein ACTTH6_00255 [Candidatus Altimarinota bacterium]|jgi:hypothetical protein